MRDDDAGDRALGLGDPEGAVEHVPHLCRVVDRLDERPGHILEEGGKVDLLLELASLRHLGDLTHDGHHRLMVEPGIVEPVEQVNGARSLGGQADPHLARELGMGAGHQRRRLLMREPGRTRDRFPRGSTPRECH